MKLTMLPLIACVGMIAGCSSTIKIRPLPPSDAAPAEGLVYCLPMRVLEVEATFVIQDCALNETSGKTALTCDVKSTVKSRIVADAGRSFIVEKGLTGRALIALDLGVQAYENGTLGSVNMTAEDRTAQAAVSLISGAFKFALAGARIAAFSNAPRSLPQKATARRCWHPCPATPARRNCSIAPAVSAREPVNVI